MASCASFLANCVRNEKAAISVTGKAKGGILGSEKDAIALRNFNKIPEFWQFGSLTDTKGPTYPAKNRVRWVRRTTRGAARTLTQWRVL